MPWTSACEIRSSTESLRHSRSCSRRAPRGSLHFFREFDHALGRVRPAIEEHVLDPFEQVLRDVLVDRELAGVDDPHVHSGADRVEQERRVKGLAHPIVAAKGKREVADAAADLGAGELLLDQPRCFDEIDPEAVVALESGRDREDVGIEDDVVRVETRFVDQQPVGTLADRELSLDAFGLTLLVERHHHHARAVAADFFRFVEEVGSRLPSS